MTKHRASKKSGKTKPVSRHKTPAKPTQKVGLLLLGIIVFIATIAVVITISLLGTDRKSQSSKQLPQSNTSSDTPKKSDQAVFPAKPGLTVEEEIAALKAEELELAETLMKDFLNNENSLMVMGNVLNRHGNTVEAMKFYNRILKINPGRADIYEVVGKIFLEEGKFEEAIGCWRKALDVQSRLTGVHSNIGHALMILGRRDEAIEEFEQEIQISPDSSLAHFLLGQAYLQDKEYEKAGKNYEMAIKINPEHSNAYYGLSIVCAKLGKSDKAEKYLQRFKKLKAELRKGLKGRKVLYNDFVETQKLAALTYIEAGQMYRDVGKLDKAEELLKKAAGLDPENSVCLLELTSLYQKNGRQLKALQMLKKIGEIEPDNAICQFQIAVLSSQLKLFNDAENALRKVITLAPQQSAGYRELAGLYLKTNKKLLQARQLAEKAVALEATAVNYFVLSWACDKNGDTANALSAIKRAVMLEPNNQQYLRFYKLIQQRN